MSDLWKLLTGSLLPIDQKELDRIDGMQHGIDLLHGRGAPHEYLIGLGSRDLRRLAIDATHQHYKGGLYCLLGEALHTETEEKLVAYYHVYPYEQRLFVRPYDMFFDNVTRFGKTRPRFVPLSKISAKTPSFLLT